MSLTHLKPIFHCYTPLRFLTFSGGIDMEHWAKMGQGNWDLTFWGKTHNGFFWLEILGTRRWSENIVDKIQNLPQINKLHIAQVGLANHQVDFHAVVNKSYFSLCLGFQISSIVLLQMMLGGGVLFSWQQKPNQSVFVGNSKNRLDFTKKQEILLKTRFMVSLVFYKKQFRILLHRNRYNERQN